MSSSMSFPPGIALNHVIGLADVIYQTALHAGLSHQQDAAIQMYAICTYIELRNDSLHRRARANVPENSGYGAKVDMSAQLAEESSFPCSPQNPSLDHYPQTK